MANTLETGSQAKPLVQFPKLEFQSGPYSYRIEKNIYTVTDGRNTISAPIHWAMGQGKAGQTYVIEREGKLYETRVSFYEQLKSLDLTLGAPTGVPKDLKEAVGRELSPKAAAECFGCHSTIGSPSQTVRGTLAWTKTLTPGVQCESCHRGATAHAGTRAKLASLKKLSTEEQSDLCGSCHRTWADIAANGPHGIGNVRFQPYRIAKSKCYDAVDRRIACTACHDPHSGESRASARIDAACRSCHANGCRIQEKNNCASCHMPKYELPGSHHRFTDHWIRTVKNRDVYPD